MRTNIVKRTRQGTQIELAKLVVRLQVCTGAKQITEGAKRIASVAKYANHDERSDEKDTTKLGDGQ